MFSFKIILQFYNTLSFEKIIEGNHAWKAYKQFCEMFLSLMFNEL